MRKAQIIILFLLLLLVAVPLSAVNYEPYQMPGQVQSTYVAKGIYVSSTKKQPKAVGSMAVMPTATFSSTSSYAGTLHQNEATPMLNVDGSIAGAVCTSGPRKAGPGTPGGGDPDDQQINTPVGDAVWPLLLMALIFGGVVFLRRRKLTH